MSGKALIVLIAFIGWFAISWRWYTCGVKSFCGDDDDSGESTESTIPLPNEAGNMSPRTVTPLLFTWSEARPTANESFAALPDSLSKEVGTDEALKITGQYFAQEENATTYPDLGLARAYETKTLLAGSLDTSQIVIASQEVAPRSGVQNEPFSSVTFTTVPVISDEQEMLPPIDTEIGRKKNREKKAKENVILNLP